MGGFVLTGPNYIFTKKDTSNLRCNCRGLEQEIDSHIEDQLLLSDSIKKGEFFTLLSNPTVHIGVSNETLFEYEIKKKKSNYPFEY